MPDDVLKKGKTPSKRLKKTANKKKEPTLGNTILDGIDSYDKVMRDLYRPLTAPEKAKMKALADESKNCLPDSEDVFIVHKLMDALQMIMEVTHEFPSECSCDEEIDVDEMIFGMGMAYERLKSKGLL